MVWYIRLFVGGVSGEMFRKLLTVYKYCDEPRNHNYESGGGEPKGVAPEVGWYIIVLLRELKHAFDETLVLHAAHKQIISDAKLIIMFVFEIEGWGNSNSGQRK